MDASILNPFLSSCKDAFSQMFGILPQNKDPYLLNPVSTHPWEISGIVGVSGDAVGIVAFRLHRILARKMLEISGITIDSPEERESMERDLVTEFTNVITGNAVSAIVSRNITVSSPIVIVGANHVISWLKNTHIIGVPFSTRHGMFEVDLCFKGM
ncbi:MAG: chemotaxis protein CheX [Treponema sp.]|nr:chemotaxis protein CheX [Treponema sp.]